MQRRLALTVIVALIVVVPAVPVSSGSGCPEVKGDLSPDSTAHIEFKLYDFKGCVVPIRRGDARFGAREP